MSNIEGGGTQKLSESIKENMSEGNIKDELSDSKLVDELKHNVEELQETNRQLKLELLKEFEVRNQFINDFEYIRTESDYRITNEDLETMKSEKIRLSQEDRSLFNEIKNLMQEKFGLKIDVTKDNIMGLLRRSIEKVASIKQNPPKEQTPEEIENIKIENDQLKKEIGFLSTQCDHLKKTLQKDRDLRKGNNENAMINQLLDLINGLLAGLDMSHIDVVDIPQIKESFNSIAKSRKKLQVEMRAKEELIEDLRINSLKVSSERENGNNGSAKGGEDFNKMKDLLVKYHNVRRKLESSLSDNEKLKIDYDSQLFEIEDLKKTIEIENKQRESIEIQLNILKQSNSVQSSTDIKEHVKKLFEEFFRVLMETKDLSQANQILEVLTSIIGYSSDDKTKLFEGIKKSKIFDKILKKK